MGGTLERHLSVLRLGAQFFLERPDFLRMCCRDGYSWGARFPASASGDDLVGGLTAATWIRLLEPGVTRLLGS